MATILAFAGSNSSTSINHKLVKYTTSLIKTHKIQLYDMTRYPFPMYSEDDEKRKGFSNSLVEFKNDIQRADALVISVNEYNGNPSGYFKNVIDWLSRLERKFLQDKTIFLMSTSGGKGGAANSLKVVKNMLPIFGADIVATFSLPSFKENFTEDGIVDKHLKDGHQKALDTFLQNLK
ncbi:Chromate reductase [Flagellimonas maritima]|uniref:Chromate reductase n=1 Tax=Flagellimonas maritima TaxID=1383885 RepID=A0A2Z4LX32_9FLAO|nr:NAD(P)H-dependent oxidoreductase [Allomuricauda aurantiaca]AWX46280.1 Chromate reductase [Allomuricauda aurantiaca]